ncbi:MAG: chloride channel protein [Candidatus Sulfobium sp.]
MEKEKDKRELTQPLRLCRLLLLAIITGALAGLGAAVFRAMVGLSHNLLFLGRLSVSYDAGLHTAAGPFGWLIIFVPVAGAAVVTFLVKNFAPGARGSGVPEVMDAVYYNRGVVSPITPAVKALASSFSLGSGGSIGREGPIMQIGASLGSFLGQIFPVAVWERNTLIAAGAAGGIAATFSTPIGGLLFAVELLLFEVSARTVIPVAISTATGAYVGSLLLGASPPFVITGVESFTFQAIRPTVLLCFAGLGVLTGALSALFIKTVYGFEDVLDKYTPQNYYLRHMASMFVVGLSLYLLIRFTGHYYIEGVGYATIRDVLSGLLSHPYLLLALFLLKLLATAMTLGSGASGGIFSPSLYMGAMAGGLYGMAALALFPAAAPDVSAFAVAGMAGMVGGSTGAAMATAVMIFEMTLDYSAIVPIIVTVAISYGVRRLFTPESFYTMKLARRGHGVPESFQTNMLRLRKAREIMDVSVKTIPVETTPDELGRIAVREPLISYFLVEDGDHRITGVIEKVASPVLLEKCGMGMSANELAKRDFIFVPENTSVSEIISMLHGGKVSVALVTAPGPQEISASMVKGVITDRQLGAAALESAASFSE